MNLPCKESPQKGWIFCLFIGPQFWNRILCQMIDHEILIPKSFEYAIGFRNIERQKNHQLLRKYDTNNFYSFIAQIFVEFFRNRYLWIF